MVTDAELDHTVGIMLLREARRLQLCATPAVLGVLENDSRILPVTRAFAEVKATAMSPGSGLSLATVTAATAGCWWRASSCQRGRRCSPAPIFPATPWG